MLQIPLTPVLLGIDHARNVDGRIHDDRINVTITPNSSSGPAPCSKTLINVQTLKSAPFGSHSVLRHLVSFSVRTKTSHCNVRKTLLLLNFFLPLPLVDGRQLNFNFSSVSPSRSLRERRINRLLWDCN